MKIIKWALALLCLAFIAYLFLGKGISVKYGNVKKDATGALEIYFSSNSDDIEGAYNMACALSEKTKYPNVFPEDGVAIFGNNIKKYGSGKYKSIVDVRGYSRSGEYPVGKFDLIRELSGAKTIDCVIYRRGFFNWGSVSSPMSMPAEQLIKLYE